VGLYSRNHASLQSTSEHRNCCSRASRSRPTLNIKIRKEFEDYLSGLQPPQRLQPISIPTRHVRLINNLRYSNSKTPSDRDEEYTKTYCKTNKLLEKPPGHVKAVHFAYLFVKNWTEINIIIQQTDTQLNLNPQKLDEGTLPEAACAIKAFDLLMIDRSVRNM
jgi:hypothetical protein